VEGASALPLALPPQAPSTTLRVVPLPQFVSLRGGGCSFVIARSNATKQSSFPRKLWIASLPLAMTHETSLSRRLRVRVRRTTTQNTPQQKGRRKRRKAHANHVRAAATNVTIRRCLPRGYAPLSGARPPSGASPRHSPPAITPMAQPQNRVSSKHGETSVLPPHNALS
jgi:hypothetical protein